MDPEDFDYSYEEDYTPYNEPLSPILETDTSLPPPLSEDNANPIDQFVLNAVLSFQVKLEILV
ncbi:7052_t:CDS:2 [Cetraspora pellucida]|uniref:7052_t:CDS:1 n=1 Tax=Cetraspora pellucida TaxID=1433469 RepID=A0A9N9EQC6_9GLOM|nr:7052_t:CDS:2 [Cetraspora pellucida]